MSSPNRAATTSLDVRALDLERRDVGLRRWTSSPGVRGQADRVEQHVRAREGEPEVFSPSRSMTGSLTMPPSGAVIRTYLPWPTAHFRQVAWRQQLGERNPSGPVTSSCARPPRPRAYVVSRCQYSASKSSKLMGRACGCRPCSPWGHRPAPPRRTATAQPSAALDQAHVERLDHGRPPPALPTALVEGRRPCAARAARKPTPDVAGPEHPDRSGRRGRSASAKSFPSLRHGLMVARCAVAKSVVASAPVTVPHRWPAGPGAWSPNVASGSARGQSTVGSVRPWSAGAPGVTVTWRAGGAYGTSGPIKPAGSHDRATESFAWNAANPRRASSSCGGMFGGASVRQNRHVERPGRCGCPRRRSP